MNDRALSPAGATSGKSDHRGNCRGNSGLARNSAILESSPLNYIRNRTRAPIIGKDIKDQANDQPAQNWNRENGDRVQRGKMGVKRGVGGSIEEFLKDQDTFSKGDGCTARSNPHENGNEPELDFVEPIFLHPRQCRAQTR
jgi:hypothetical protein